MSEKIQRSNTFWDLFILAQFYYNVSIFIYSFYVFRYYRFSANIDTVRKKINPLSPFVKSKIFTHDPTSTQVKAIDIALNTPDIAIIQGPPGTGKTTVITAIIERLNEIADKRKDVKGQVLVTLNLYILVKISLLFVPSLT